MNKPSLLHHPLGEWPDDTKHSGKEALDRVVLEQDIPGPHLGENAPETPDIDLVVVLAALEIIISISEFRGLQ